MIDVIRQWLFRVFMVALLSGLPMAQAQQQIEAAGSTWYGEALAAGDGLVAVGSEASDFVDIYRRTADGWQQDGRVLATDGMNFTGPAGVAEGLKTRIVFTSLAPLETAPNQKVTVSRIQSAVPFENLDLGVQFKGDHVAVEGATVQSPGGPVRLEAMRLPLDGETPITGVVAFKGLDFGKVIAAATREIEIGKSGFERWVERAARRHGFLYGLAAVLLSLGLGWAAAAAFRRRA